METLLVTGYTGFVGANLVPYMAQQGWGVIGVGRYPTHTGIKQYNYSRLDKIKGYRAVIHLAGKAHDLKSITDESEYFAVNTELTISVFKHFLQSEAADFIYLSTVKAAADTVDGALTEDVIPAPVTAYGRSKLQAEQYLLNTALPAGKRVIVLRPCMIHGPGNKGNLNLLYRLVSKGLPYPLAAFENRRSLLSVNNLLFVISQILSNVHIPSGIYNVADDQPLATNEIIDVLAQAAGKKPVKWHVNTGLIKRIARAGDKLRLPLTTERLQKLTDSYVVSNHKIKQALQINHMPVSAVEGLKYTAGNF